MRYEGSIYRPPSEAYSYILQVTVGCSHNRCTFCSMYKDKKFRIRPMEEILEDIRLAGRQYGSVSRVFLADGNALVLKTEDLKRILAEIRETFPGCERVGIYSAPKDILGKPLEELRSLKELGLGIAYMGVESGSGEILRRIKKGVTPEEMIQAGQRLAESGIRLSITLISGIGGRALWKEHAIESARVINAISPHYLGLLTLLVEPGTELQEQIRQGTFELPGPKEVMAETRLLVENLEVRDCIFRSNHASNYHPLAGTLPRDRDRLLAELDGMIHHDFDFKDEYYRRL